MSLNSLTIARAFAPTRYVVGLLLLFRLLPSEAFACACGCSVFDVGSVSLLPKEGDHGGAVYFEWDHMNQATNWSSESKSSPNNNGDKNLRTDWYVVGLNYMLNRDWQLKGEFREEWRTSNQPGNGYWSNVYLIGVRWQR